MKSEELWVCYAIIIKRVAFPKLSIFTKNERVKKMPDKEQLYTNKIFLCGALPLLKTIVQDVPSLKKKFEKVHCVFQVSCRDSEAPDGKWATHFVVNGDEWLIHANKVAERVDKSVVREIL